MTNRCYEITESLIEIRQQKITWSRESTLCPAEVLEKDSNNTIKDHSYLQFTANKTSTHTHNKGQLTKAQKWSKISKSAKISNSYAFHTSKKCIN